MHDCFVTGRPKLLNVMQGTEKGSDMMINYEQIIKVRFERTESSACGTERRRNVMSFCFPLQVS